MKSNHFFSVSEKTMKKALCILLTAFLLFSSLPFTVFAAENPEWNAKKQAFSLKDGPTITRILADSDENGTLVWAYIAHTDDFAKLGDLYQAAFRDDDRLFADAAGLDLARGVDGDLEVGVQLAYSFDGVHWVNDFDTDIGEEEPAYWIREDFDFDEDGFREYYNLPNEGCALDDISQKITLFDGHGGHLIPQYCSPVDGMSIKEALTIRNNTLLQGKGEFTGAAYKIDDANGGKGFMVDFNKNTIYVKARYRVYSFLDYVNAEGEWVGRTRTAAWSDWGPVKTYNNKTASVEKQEAAPAMTALKTEAAPTLKVLSYERENVDRDGVTIRITEFRLSVAYPAAMKQALAKYDALDTYNVRLKFTNEGYSPHLLYEIRIGNGDWYVLETEDFNNVFNEFSDDTYWIRDEMEALGYKPGDPVYLRVRLYGSDSSRTERDEATGYDKIYDKDEVWIRSGVSKPVELSLTGKFKVNYELNGGGFPHGTTQVYQFDEATDLTVYLTGKNYTPEQKHFTFNGWFTTENFAKGTQIRKFDTKEKASRTYYAKWTELPFHTVSYNMGSITDYVYNPNATRVYSDDGVVTISDVTYSGAKFLGWYDSSSGGKKVTSLSYAGMKADVTLYARWQLPSKSIAYAGAGKDYMNNAKNPTTYQINPDGANTVLIYAPEKRGFIFDGWYLNKDLSNGKLGYNQEKDCWELDADEDVTLYAKFIRGRWDIHYELGLTGVSNSNNPDNYTYGDGVLLAEPTRTGYVFNGWYADAAFKNKATEIKGIDVGEKTFYAKWTPIEYKITYDLRGAENVSFFKNENPAVRLVDDEVILKPLTPTNKLCKFLGWYDNPNYDGKPYEKIAAGTDKNVTVYADFIKYSWGDVDFDGEVTAGDARLALRQAVGLENLPADAIAWADVDEPGAKHVISAADARVILRMAVGLDTEKALKLPEYPAGF